MIATLPPKLCPRCGEECWQMDIELVATGERQPGPWACSVCDWGEWDERDELEMPEVEP